MAHFFGGVSGKAGDATRLGNKQSGISAFVQSNESRLSVSMHYSDGQYTYAEPEPEHNAASISISGGWSTYYRGKGIGIHDLDVLAEALDLNDPKICKLWDKITDTFDKLEKEAPKAIKRNERKRAAERRAEERRQHQQRAILETLTSEENNRLIELARLEHYMTDAYELEVIPAIPCADSGAAGAMARERMVFTRPKYPQSLEHIVNLTTDEGLPQIRERMAEATA
jgi:hypothetical protein